MEISPSYRTLDWQQLNLSLDSSEEDWQEGIKMFQDRISRRYLVYIDEINRGRFSGFAVMALSCLLIETLQQFFEGVDRTPKKNLKNILFGF